MNVLVVAFFIWLAFVVGIMVFYSMWKDAHRCVVCRQRHTRDLYRMMLSDRGKINHVDVHICPSCLPSIINQENPCPPT